MNRLSPRLLRLPPAPSFSFLFLLIFFSVRPVFAAATSSATAAPATTLTRDLGQGLAYHRAALLPGDLPATEATRKQPCVLDLRYARGDAAAGAALAAWLKFRAAPRAPVFLLINSETAAPLLAPLASRAPSPGLIVIGSASTVLTPDLALKIAPDTERRAYDALAGTTLELLLNDSPEKVRNDEARLAKDHQGVPDPTTYPRPADDTFDDTPSASPSATTTPATSSPKPPSAAPLIDRALQRAVHLHRSLKALKKL
jgi:hypothetical protein